MAYEHLTAAQIATSTFPYCRCTLDFTLDSLERIGIQAFEFQAVAPLLGLEDTRPSDIRALSAKIRRHHLRAICVTPDVMNYPINLASPNEATRRRSIEYIQRAIECANGFEAPLIQMHVGYPTVDASREEAWKRSAESMWTLAEYARKQGVVITSEYSKIRWKSILQSSADLRRLIDEVGNPGYEGMSDTVVMVKVPETIDDVVRNLGVEHLRHFHFTDGLGDATSSLHMIPGEGRLNLVHVLDVLDSVGYTGYLSLELQGCETRPHEAMVKGVEWMRMHLEKKT